jgi:formate C-acetyltransferase
MLNLSDTELPLMMLSDRIQRFRTASRLRGEASPPTWRRVNFEKAFFGEFADYKFSDRYAHSMAYSFENEPVYLLPDEQLVGMLYQAGGNPAEFVEDDSLLQLYSPWKQLNEEIKANVDPYMANGGSPGHVGWHWNIILNDGIDGLLEHIRTLLANSTDEKAITLYKNAIVQWEAVLRWNDKYIAAMKSQLDKVLFTERVHLENLITICTQVPRHPARNFHEALQSFYFTYLALMFENPYGGNGPGRVDYYLWPYLERDLASGEITVDEAKELIDELFIRMHERIQQRDGWVEAVTPGGIHPDGTSSVNLLSELMVHSIAVLDQTHPSVYPRVGKNTPEKFVDLCVNYLLYGQNRAQIYNDDACLPAIIASGTPAEDAAMYMAGGCMEISVQGMNSDLNFACIHNIAKTLELVITGGIDMLNGSRRISLNKDITAYANYEDLYQAFEQELAREYREMVTALDIQSKWYAKYRPCYLLSSLTGDCLERGREQQDGGARYHEYGFSALAVTAAADSLMGIKRAVYDEGITTTAELLAAMRGNFKGYDSLRSQLQKIPKYGQENVEADKLCSRVLNSVCKTAMTPKNRFGGQLKPMLFNFVWTPSASLELGARGDGSLAGDYIGHGMTPQRQGMTHGITAAINSTVSLDFKCVAGGATTMWDVDDRWITFEGMKAILQVFLSGGGMIFQGNTTSVAELEKAMEKPEDYPNLIVRVGGFSARFVALDDNLQQEIITRYRHSR